MEGSRLIQSSLSASAKQQKDVRSITEAQSNAGITYEDLWQAVGTIRAYLGGQPQTVVMALPGGIVNSVLWLACLTGGHRLVPISPELTDYEYAQAIRKHTPDFIIADRANTTQAAKSITAAGIRRIVHKNAQGSKPALAKPREGSVYLSTSGSTGQPKGIILSATQCTAAARNIIASHRLTSRDRCLTPLPFYHVNAPIVGLLATILSGGQLMIAPKYSTGQFWQWVQEFDPTWISLVPTMVAMLLSAERPTFLDTSSLRFIRTASAPLPKAVLDSFEEKFKIPLIETYGLSEAASTITANPVPPGVHKAGSVGLPIGIDLQIYNPKNQQAAEQGTVGEVLIRGRNVITAYVDSVGQDAFCDGWLRTGDLGYVDADGYVFLTGRSKDIIICGGENVFPREIEEVLVAFPAVREAVVVGAPDPLYGERIVAFITAAGNNSPDITDELATFARRQLSRRKVPAVFYMLGELPKNRTGKVDRPALRQRAANLGRTPRAKQKAMVASV